MLYLARQPQQQDFVGRRMIKFQAETISNLNPRRISNPGASALFTGKDEKIAKELLEHYPPRTWFERDLSISPNIPARFKSFLTKVKTQAIKQGYEDFLF